MRRTPLRPRSYCDACGRTLCTCGERPRLRRGRLRPISPKRHTRRSGRVYGDYHAWVGTLPCVLADRGCIGGVSGHHVTSVGAGGEDYGNEAPLCAGHHTELHTAGRDTFEGRHEVNLALVAVGLAKQWMEAMAP